MSVLGAGLARVDAGLGGQVLLAVFLGDEVAGGLDGLRGHAGRVGAHVGDEAHGALAEVRTFIEALGVLHRAADAHLELLGGLLLQLGRGEGGRRVAALLLGLQAGHFIGGLLQGGLEGLGLGSVCHPALGGPVAGLQGLAPQLHQLHPEGGRQGGGEAGLEHPVFDGVEGQDLPLPVHDDAHGHALHPASAEAPADLFPQHLADLVAHQPVEHPAGPLGVHQLAVDDGGGGHGLLDAGGGDLIKEDAVHRQGLGGLDGLQQVPADGLPLAVRVRCEDQLVGGLGGGPQLPDHLLFGRTDLVLLLEAVLHIHAQLPGQVADMTHGGHDLVALAEVLGDGLRLGWAFHDHEFGH